MGWEVRGGCPGGRTKDGRLGGDLPAPMCKTKARTRPTKQARIPKTLPTLAKNF